MKPKNQLPFPMTAMVDTGYPMSNKKRDLFLRVIDGQYQNLERITNRLFFLDNHFPPAKLEKALAWLLIHKCVGAKFLVWFKEECHNSDLEMHRLLLTVVDNVEGQAIVAGKNFRV